MRTLLCNPVWQEAVFRTYKGKTYCYRVRAYMVLSGKKIYSNYSDVFKALCDGIGIPCKIVDANKKAVNPSHEWTIVKLNNKWYICDPQAGFFLVGAKYYKQMGLRWNTKKYPKVCEQNHAEALAYASIL